MNYYNSKIARVSSGVFYYTISFEDQDGVSYRDKDKEKKILRKYKALSEEEKDKKTWKRKRRIAMQNRKKTNRRK